MGNPSIRIDDTPQAAAPSANGILARVGGQFISAASDTLPPPAEGGQPERTVEVEVPGLGPVRITYRLSSYKHRRSRHWHWIAVRADLP